MSTEDKKQNFDVHESPHPLGALIIGAILAGAGYLTGGWFGIFIGICVTYLAWIISDPPWLKRK